MNRKNIVTAFSTAVIVSIGLTSCKKDTLHPSGKTQPASGIESTTKSPAYSEGIKSHHGFPAYGQTAIAYYAFYDQAPGQQSLGYYYGIGDPASPSKCYGACTGHEVVVYKQDLAYYIGSVTIMLNSTTIFPYVVEEIEIHPQTLEVYALAKVGTAMRIFKIDESSGIATPVTCNGGPNAFNSTSFNGYKSGSITFVPNVGGTYDLVYTHESTVYASAGLTSWHFSISGNALTGIVADHRTYTGLSGTGPINTTYGNGNLYFTRDVAGTTSSPLYTLSLATSNVTASTGLSIANFNDFGYWKAF